MRSAVLGALAAALTLGGSAWAQKEPTIRTITQPQAEVRSGPSTNEQFVVTNRLSQGARVEVLEELPDGWLKIRPPERSFSWISPQFLAHIVPHQPNYVVIAEGQDVPVFVGSAIVKGRTIISTKLKRGTQVTCIGPAQDDKDGSWMPIDPPPGEVRYLRAEAVGLDPASKSQTAASAISRTAAVTTSGSGAAPGGGPGRLAPSAAPSARPQTTVEGLYRQAVEAERTGQVGEAIKFYLQAAAETATTSPAWSAQATQRAQYLQSGYQGYPAGAAPTQSRYPAPGTGGQATVPAGRTYPLPAATPTVRMAGPSGSGTPVSRDGGGAAPAHPWYAGRLKRAGRSDLYRHLYVLEFSGPDGNPYIGMYVTPQEGTNLEPYVNRTIQVTGPVDYNGELRGKLMTAQRALFLP
jgi:hypothetical protein